MQPAALAVLSEELVYHSLHVERFITSGLSVLAACAQPLSAPGQALESRVRDADADLNSCLYIKGGRILVLADIRD
jgi:hypothetical protein